MRSVQGLGLGPVSRPFFSQHSGTAPFTLPWLQGLPSVRFCLVLRVLLWQALLRFLQLPGCCRVRLVTCSFLSFLLVFARTVLGFPIGVESGGHLPFPVATAAFQANHHRPLLEVQPTSACLPRDGSLIPVGQLSLLELHSSHRILSSSVAQSHSLVLLPPPHSDVPCGWGVDSVAEPRRGTVGVPVAPRDTVSQRGQPVPNAGSHL